MHKLLKLLFLILALSCLFGCNRNQIQAENSLAGDWSVVAITSYYGEFDQTRFNATETVEESGSLGSFSFSDSSVDFRFTRNDTLFAGNTPWTLTAEKVNAGFVRVPRFTLALENEFAFVVAFEDESKKAERNAANMRLTSLIEDEVALFIEMSLEKN